MVNGGAGLGLPQPGISPVTVSVYFVAGVSTGTAIDELPVFPIWLNDPSAIDVPPAGNNVIGFGKNPVVAIKEPIVIGTPVAPLSGLTICGVSCPKWAHIPLLLPVQPANAIIADVATARMMFN
jgi:hypothetical protein